MSNSNILTSNRAKEIGKIGGIKSGEARRKKRDLKKLTQYLLNQKINVKVLKYLNLSDIVENMKYDEAILMSQFVKAINGDTSAAVYIRDTSGQKPKEEFVQEHHMTYEDFIKLISGKEKNEY